MRGTGREPGHGAGRGRRALVLGGGIMGLCSAWALDRDGWSVELIDQDPVPNPRGASHDQHRLIRHAYGSAHGYMRMVDGAHAAWDTLFESLGEGFFVPTGTLALSDAPGGWLADSRTALDGADWPAGLASEWRRGEDIDPALLPHRFPVLSSDGLHDALLLPTGGALLADRILAALARHLTARGVGVRRGRAVAVDSGRAVLRLENGDAASADLLVVAAGPWAPRLWPGLAGRVVASRQTLVYLEPPAALREAWAAMPMVIDLSDSGGFYAVPPVVRPDGTRTGLKIGDHRFSMTGDPDDPRAAGADEAEAILEVARPRLHGLAGYRVLEARACYYDVSDAERFVLEAPAPDTLVLSGFSGHGFKFGALLGLAVAEAARDPSRRPALAAWAAGEAEQGVPGVFRG